MQNKSPQRARKVFAQALKTARADVGWSQEELAAQADVHRTYVGQVERSEKNISIDSMQKLADALERPLWSLLKV